MENTKQILENFDYLVLYAIDSWKYPKFKGLTYVEETLVFKDLVTLSFVQFLKDYWNHIIERDNPSQLKSLNEKFQWHLESMNEIKDVFDLIFRHLGKEYPNYELKGTKDELYEYIVHSLPM